MIFQLSRFFRRLFYYCGRAVEWMSFAGSTNLTVGEAYAMRSSLKWAAEKLEQLSAYETNKRKAKELKQAAKICISIKWILGEAIYGRDGWKLLHLKQLGKLPKVFSGPDPFQDFHDGKTGVGK